VLGHKCTEFKNISILLLIITVLVISCYSFLEFHCLNVHVYIFAQILFYSHFPPTDCAVSFCHKVVYYFLLVIWFLYDLEQEQYTLNNYNCYIFILKFYCLSFSTASFSVIMPEILGHTVQNLVDQAARICASLLIWNLETIIKQLRVVSPAPNVLVF